MDYIWIVEINSFCSVVMGIVLYSLYKNYDRQTKQRCYMKAVLFAVLSFISEMLWALIESRILLFPRYANFFVNAVYDVAACCTGYFWLCYVETSLESKFIQSRLLKTIALLPVVIIIAAVIGSFFNGFLFYIDENNKYVRGKYLYLHVVMCQLYTLITSAHAFYKSIETKSYMKKIEYRILSMFLIFPLVLGLIQIFVPHIPSISVGITLSFLFVYIDLQNLLISVDTLTSLNNRNQLMRYLSMRI